jgi:predicted RNA binding protein YcfA (HicA-like mRNA interferase family)
VLPALAGVVLVAGAAAAGLAAAYRALGAGVPLAVLALVALAVPVVTGRRRPLVRRRLGYYTPQELAELDVDGLALAVCRMLRRDGWTVRREAGSGVRPRVRARHDRGHRLEVVFRPVAEPLPDEDPPLPPAPA